MWNQRYDRPDYLFGTEPAEFVRRHAGLLPAGADVLCLADGEGRNSVYLASLGHRVTAFDSADIALEKARALARARGVEVAFASADIFDPAWAEGDHDAVFAVFIQFMGPAERARIFDLIKQAVRPGGLVFLHGYAPRQVGYGTGGPPFEENMYTLPMLHQAFAGWDILHEADYDAQIDEGPGHSGRSGLIDFIARRPDGG